MAREIITGENREDFVNKKLKKSKTPKISAGEMGDRAWSLSAKKFPSTEAAEAHREAAKHYRNENQHEHAERHESAAFSHMKSMMKK